MRTKSVLLCVPLFIGITISSCGKDEIETPSVPNEKDTTVIVPPKEDIIYVIDTTKKITINEIKFWEDYNMATVSGSWNGVAYIPYDKFVAVGSNGQFAISTDGTNWTTQTVGGSQWYDIAYGNGRVMAVGSNGQIAYSTNGTSWTISAVGSNTWRGVAYGNSMWVAVGKGSGVADGQIAYSTDGIFWTTQTVYGPEELRGVAYDNYNHRWIAVGGGGMVFSTDGTSWTYKGGSVDWNGITIKQIQ
jgi:hypothetical protein